MAHHMQSGKQHKVWKKCKSSFCWHVYDKIRTYKMIKQQNEICKRENYFPQAAGVFGFVFLWGFLVLVFSSREQLSTKVSLVKTGCGDRKSVV